MPVLRSPQLLLFWLATAACVIGQVALLRAMVAGRAPGTSRQAVARWTEVAWVILPAVILGLVLFATWRAVDTQPPPGTAPTVRAEAPAAVGSLRGAP